VAYEDFPNLPKPQHVDEQAWEICLGNYRGALARYRAAVIAAGDEISKGAVPTADQSLAEGEARSGVAIARRALLDLSASGFDTD
jgi:hypothetical protein